MTNNFDNIPHLLEQGETFTYENFSFKSERGYPSALSEDWLVWTHRVGQVLGDIDRNSPIAKSIRDGLGTTLIGNDSDDFVRAKNLIMSGLRAASKIFGSDSNIPASDRVVTIDHNSDAYSEALANLEKLIKAVRETNDYPSDQEDREQKIAELTAGRHLITATRVRIQAAKALLEPTLRWFMEKFSGAIVSQLASAAWKAIQHVLS